MFTFCILPNFRQSRGLKWFDLLTELKGVGKLPCIEGKTNSLTNRAVNKLRGVNNHQRIN